MLNKMNVERIDRAIKFMKNKAFQYINTSESDDVVTILTVLYDYRRDLVNPERKCRGVS